MKRQREKIGLFTAALLVLGTPVFAQKAQQMDELIVTAQKTEENVRDVPVAISVFDGYTLEDRNLDTVSDIARYTPGLEIVSYGSAAKYSPSMRGLYADYTTNSSVAGLYVDGVPITGGTGYDETLMDIERVEVLKGPQGTLYGKNTEVGVINVITRKPGNDPRARIKLTAGEDNKKEVAFNASGALVKDRFFIGVSGKHYEKDGFVRNYNTGEMVDDREHNYGKIYLRYTPGPDFEAAFVSSLVKYDDDAQAGGLAQFNREVGNDLDAYNHSSIFQSAFTLNYRVNGNLALSSTTAYRDYNENNGNDWDYSDNFSRRFHAWSDSTLKTLSEEVKLNYEKDGLKLVSGLFYEIGDTHIHKDNDKWWLASVQPAGYDTDSKSLGVFTHVTYQFTDKLAILGGLRFDNDQETFEDATQTIDYDENELSPKLGAIYHLSKDLMTYLTLAKGYRTGGFNLTAPAGYSKTFDKECLYSYEMGLKGSAFKGRLTYDTAVYYMDITDMQIDEYITPASGIKTNAAKATSQGIETSVTFRINRYAHIFGGFSYNDIEFDEYKDVRGDYSGNRTTFSPEYNFNLGVVFRSDRGFYASADITGYGDMYLDSKNQYKRDAYELVNAKLGYEQDHFDIYIYGKNLFDKRYDTIGHYNGVYSYFSPPREIGLQAAYRL